MKKLFPITFLILFTSFSQSFATIKVATPGDYAPFSNYDPGIDSYNGLDINMIEDFAKSINEDINFTTVSSWPVAISDLADNKFDILIGGVTITPARKKDFLFSKPLISFSKVAVSLCSNKAKYQNFSDIDNENVSVIEDRGSTNEKFASKHLKNAMLVIINNKEDAIISLSKAMPNTNIPADIMFMDSIEIVHLNKSSSPDLCALDFKVDDNTAYKAFLFNKSKDGVILSEKFNKWLDNNPDALKEYKDSLSG